MNIYLDHAASTPVHPEVAEAMLKVMTGQFGNASSVHAFGRAAKRTVSSARDKIAAFLGSFPDELIFTSGGTESDNLAIFGALSAHENNGKHIITTSIEHHAVLHSFEQLEQEGYEVTYLPVDSYGLVSTDDVISAIRPDTILISVMYANNEVGTIQPIEEIGSIAREHGVLFHVDAVQALGSVPINLHALPVDMMSFSAHKINGPQGVGALYLRREVKLNPIAFGGLQERKRRAGTENMAGIVGFATAVELAASHMEDRTAHDLELRSVFLEELSKEVGEGEFVLNGHPEQVLPHIVNVSFPSVKTETMLMNLDVEGIACASGSACTSGSLSRSHVLEAMQLPEEIMDSAIRFSFGLGNTKKDLVYTAQKVGTIIKRLRSRA
ncbi:cysteine desulfurase family protein [Paenibacillus urinalis]|uniref:cysteine desulfurase n=1 Tax=Paenibacillus urinalis TaxID=521520 RepID=A0AAX3MXJ7_9BACL|nr:MULTISPECIES: cysteine desulfurase family protein [Paenibacillus]WDH81758.1 cysteine desulfurase family protein [Paenibacillus urinalis]WDH97809.1 cysteine desulfurase family protein [Paenibacillus urinalis]WDI01485.1 cysteine desulfurase family protein [Paenibacillus urinalis]GAK42269.1 aminotransferase [Paenibacillus sp. TCA20]